MNALVRRAGALLVLIASACGGEPPRPNDYVPVLPIAVAADDRSVGTEAKASASTGGEAVELPVGNFEALATWRVQSNDCPDPYSQRILLRRLEVTIDSDGTIRLEHDIMPVLIGQLENARGTVSGSRTLPPYRTNGPIGVAVTGDVLVTGETISGVLSETLVSGVELSCTLAESFEMPLSR